MPQSRGASASGYQAGVNAPVDTAACVRPGLLLSGLTVEADAASLRQAGVSHVLQVGDGLSPSHPGQFQYLSLLLLDQDDADLVSLLPACCDFIDGGIRGGGTVLVHCGVGVSRSAAVVCAYLMWSTGVGFKEARASLKAVRPKVNPNLGFALQLQLLEGGLRSGDSLLAFASAWAPWDSNRMLAAAWGGAADDRTLASGAPDGRTLASGAR
ncbi:hypothetical protein FOA52_003869 [Chlamydomonas sp. UWO 241]|nr:hypothetical protein FOA52_003869 [Chlamydomonas sp. UWO 241]